MNKVRTRFAPSPTGFLHIGSLRTVLFTYLIAKINNGKFILRIEDTDQKRLVEGAVEKLIEIIDWLGIKFDEGPHIGGDYGPYTQTERLEIYNKHIEKLLKKGKAYYCFCTPERLEKMRANQQKDKKPPRYDRKCRNLSQKNIKKKLAAGDRYVIRQKMPESGEVIVKDELRGEIKFKASELEDHVLIKSNGIPTYQFAVVVDDHEMEISHVVRGEEWIPSFPKNILLYQAFGYVPPKFIHLPLTLNKGGGKLSKRQGDVAVEDYQAKGYLPEALLNYSALLGWHPKDENEIFNIDKLIKTFQIQDMGISSAIFDIEKLDYFNGYYIRQLDADRLLTLSMPFLEKYWAQDTDSRIAKPIKEFAESYIKKILILEQERLKRLDEIGELTEFFFVDKLAYSKQLLIWKKLSIEEVKDNLNIVKELLLRIPDENWTNDSIEEALITHIKAKKLKVGDYLWPMRVALTGKKASPGPFDTAEILGKKITIERIIYAINI